MTKVNIVIPDEVLMELRHAVIEKYGGAKGSLSRGVTEAVKLWLEQESKGSEKK